MSKFGISDFTALYGHRADKQPERYEELYNLFRERFGVRANTAFFSAPGRTEIGGNHTDHNRGRVLCGAVNLDIIAVAAPWDEPYVCVQSVGHEENRVQLDDLAVRDAENPSSNALIRGVLARFRELGYPIGGFCAYTTTDVLGGSGLSSSAAFEVLLCTILDKMFGKGDMEPVLQAQISQYAENTYFHKPCGLMDQTACAVGNLLQIDFQDPKNPVVSRLNAGLPGYRLCVTAPGGDHAGLTGEYAAITHEMRSVAEAMGVSVLRETEEAAFMVRLPELRERCGDRAVLRAMHFFADNRRVPLQAEALESGDMELFLSLVRESGRSSFMYLQNVFACHEPHNQGLTLALALSERMLGTKGAYRVHGGGFAGTIQAFVPEELLSGYQQEMDAVFGSGSCMVLEIRPQGGVQLPLTIAN